MLRSAIRAGNAAVRQEAAKDVALSGMGTTVVVLRIYTTPGPEAVIAHVGDSRAYLFRTGRLRQLTTDHSMVEDYRRRGVLSEEQAQVHPLRHVLSRAVGPDPGVEPDVTTVGITHGDRLLLCTDGLTKMLTHQEMMAVLSRGTTVESTCAQLVAEANRRGGEDNITVVLIEYRD
jgi:protein phosphatase